MSSLSSTSTESTMNDKQQQEEERKRVLIPLPIYTKEQKKLIKLLDHIIFNNKEILIDRTFVILTLIAGFVNRNYNTITTKTAEQLIEELKGINEELLINDSKLTSSISSTNNQIKW